MTWLDIANSLLEQEDTLARASFDRPQMPVTFIFALPRGASTPFHQLVLSSMRIGYVSNIMARFWKAPLFGAQLESDLQTEDYVSNFQSHLGNTTAPLEPHEWGWFWRHWLRLEGNNHYCTADAPPDIDELGRIFASLEALKSAPLIFKSVFGMANFNVMREAIPKVLVAHIIRPPYYVCNSIIKGRLARTGDISGFFGHRPRNIDSLLAIDDPVEQIVLQVKSILEEMKEDLRTIPSEDVFTVHQDELVLNYNNIADQYANFLAGHGVVVTRKPKLSRIPLERRNSPDLIEPAFRNRLNAHYEKHIGLPPADT